MRAAERCRLLVVHNAKAGRAGNRGLPGVAAALEARGARIRMTEIGSIDAAERLADARAWDAVVAAGGDGTLRAVLRQVHASSVPVACVPAGTGNVFAHEVGLPRDPAALAEVILNGPTVAVRGGLVGNEPFFLMAGVGFDAAIVARLDQRLKQRIGKLAYAGPMVRALVAARPELDVRIDGTPHAADWIVVQRARHYAGGFVLAPGASLLEPVLVAVLFKANSRLGRLGQLLAVATGRLKNAPGVHVVRCETVDVASAMPVPVEADGDDAALTPVRIRSDGPVAQLIVPHDYTGRERERLRACAYNSAN
ncbi:MAG: diacylglycerol kinase family protein [Hyphomicrobiaceae bacterium]